jgi:hypothetical protein
MKPLSHAQRWARILGTTVRRCEEMIRAGNAAGLSTAYMDACVRTYRQRNKRRRAVMFLRSLGEL